MTRSLGPAAVLMVLLVQPFPAEGNSQAAVIERESADLYEVLTNGLKARTAAERDFIGRVVVAVDEGLLNEGLVKAIFQRARARDSRYPLPYFVQMIKKVAQDRGVDL